MHARLDVVAMDVADRIALPASMVAGAISHGLHRRDHLDRVTRVPIHA